jgi:peptide/nickel transport system substrate-binding protein
MYPAPLFFLLKLVIVVSIFAAGCGPAGSPVGNTDKPAAERGPGKRGGSITYRFSSAPRTFNYLLAEDEASIILTFFLLNDHLVSFDPLEQEFRAEIAETWTLGEDGRTLSVVLREGLKFSDGRPITSDDVIFTLEAMYDERTNSAAFRDAMLVGDKEIATRRIDERRLELIFPEDVAHVEGYMENLAILPRHVLGPERDAGRLAEAWKLDADPASVVTSGPFVIESTAAGERVTLGRNPHYWRRDEAGTQLPYLDNLMLEVVPDANAAFTRLGQGLDIIDRIRSTDYAALSTAGGPIRAFDAGPGLSSDHIWFNLNRTTPDGRAVGSEVKRKWFGDDRFRRAISHAVDRESIASNTLQGLASPQYGFVPAGNRAWLDPDLPKVDYDPARSRELLAEAGFVLKGEGNEAELRDAAGNLVEFTLIVPAENEQRKLMAAVIQQDLARLGIKMTVAPIDFPSLTDRWTASYDYDAILLGLGSTSVDPSAFANFLLSSAAVHQWQPRQKTPATEWEAEIDRLFAEQDRTKDSARRHEIFNRIQQIMAAASPVIPIVSRHIVSAGHERIGNLAPSNIHPFSLWNAEEMYIRE